MSNGLDLVIGLTGLALVIIISTLGAELHWIRQELKRIADSMVVKEEKP